MTTSQPRVEPVVPPYPPELQAIFDRVMPPGVPPLSLFTTLARVPRVYERFRAGSLLDRGPLSLRHREIVIDRTCARCGCAYEWGVHVAFFAQRVAVVGYTPLNRGGFLRDAVAEIAKRHGRTTRQVTLNFLTRRAPLFTIPKASQPDHVRENAAALDFKLTPDELRAIDEAF